MRWIARTALIAAAGLTAVTIPARAQEKEKPKKGDRYTIIEDEYRTREELKTAWDITRALRPNWFRNSAKAASADMFRNEDRVGDYPVVYIDNIRQSSIEVLREYRNAEIAEIKYMDPQKAMALYDDSHRAGAIFVTTNRLKR